MKSFIDIEDDSDFTIYNLPFGLYRSGSKGRACTRIGDRIIDFYELHKMNFFDGLSLSFEVLEHDHINDLIGLGKAVTSAMRLRIQNGLLLGGALEQYQHNEKIFLLADHVEMMLPIHIGDYTDFYSSKEHATNVGKMFRDPENALLPNWLHLPVGYHGRSSSIVPSGVAIKRPSGQTMPDGATQPEFGPSKLVDFELEMGFVIGKSTEMGETISTDNAEDYIFGLMLFNDWSARDIQKWEYVPLGPFLAKNFGSTVSPWIVPLEALEDFRVEGPKQTPEVLPYLQFSGQKNYDIELSVDIIAESGANVRVCTSNFKYMYWNMCQQLAHHTVNGCNVNVGDLLASGTISGPTEDSFGSMLEITWKGTKPVVLSDGSTRKFIQNGDTVKMRAWCNNGKKRLGFGACDAKILE